MGRWAQRARRGGGGRSATTGLMIVEVLQDDATSYQVSFSGAATRTATAPGANMVINGQTIISTSQTDADTIKVNVTGPTSGDLPWQLNGQLPWVTQAVTVPQTGLTTGS
jgi:hypothetical protein